MSDNSGEHAVPQTEPQECIHGSKMKPYPPWKNRDKGMKKIIKGKAKCREVRRMVTKRVWYFGLFWEA